MLRHISVVHVQKLHDQFFPTESVVHRYTGIDIHLIFIKKLLVAIHYYYQLPHSVDELHLHSFRLYLGFRRR